MENLKNSKLLTFVYKYFLFTIVFIILGMGYDSIIWSNTMFFLLLIFFLIFIVAQLYICNVELLDNKIICYRLFIKKAYQYDKIKYCFQTVLFAPKSIIVIFNGWNIFEKFLIIIPPIRKGDILLCKDEDIYIYIKEKYETKEQ
jgi:hypothetical protein